ncbi:hypothetical protein WA158_005370 [Blastocystis sp. Blastoise]
MNILQVCARNIQQTLPRYALVSVRSFSVLSTRLVNLPKHSSLMCDSQRQVRLYHSTQQQQGVIGSLCGLISLIWSEKQIAQDPYSPRQSFYKTITYTGRDGQTHSRQILTIPIWKYFVAGLLYPVSIPYYLCKPFVMKQIALNAGNAFFEQLNRFYNGQQNKYNNNYNNNNEYNRSNTDYEKTQYADNDNYSYTYRSSKSNKQSQKSYQEWNPFGSNSEYSQWTWDPKYGWRESGNTSQSNYGYGYTSNDNSNNNYNNTNNFYEDFKRQWQQYEQQQRNNNQYSYGTNDNYNSSNNNTYTAGSSMTRTQAFKVLGLDSDASKNEINQAYHKLLMKYHPDRGGSNEMAAKINEARDVLLGKK